MSSGYFKQFNQFQKNMEKKVGGMGGGGGGGGGGAAGLSWILNGAKALAGLALVGYVATHCLYNVEGGHAAIMFSRIHGILPNIIGEGTHVMVPWLERPEIFSVRVKTRSIGSLTSTKDLQMVNLALRVLSRPDMRELPTIYRTLGKDYDERVLPSICNEVMKSVVAQFTAAQLTTQREKISVLIKRNLTDRAKQFNIIMDDVAITHIGWSPEYNAAIEAKQVAYQEVERAKFIVEKAQQEKLQFIAKAEGEARSAKMISDVIQSNPFYLELKRIETARDIAHTLAKSSNKIYLNSDNLLVNMLSNLGPTKSEAVPSAPK
jgi:prohibitin 2